MMAAASPNKTLFPFTDTEDRPFESVTEDDATPPISSSFSTASNVNTPTLHFTQLGPQSAHSDFSHSEYDTTRSDCDTRPTCLFDLPWEQVLCSQILPFLDIKDLFSLMRCSTECRDLIRLYFQLQFHINTNMLGDHFSSEAFRMMTSESTALRSICTRNAKSWLTSDVLIPVISSNRNLEKFDFANCLALSGPAIYSIGVNCANIRHLCLENCVWLQMDNFLSFMTNGRNLEFLDISGCWNLDDDLVVQLVPFTSSLRHLLLANLYGLTDRSVVAIAHSCPNLVHLSIRGCWRVTDSAIKLISQYCPNLRALQVKDCRNVTEESLAELRAKKVRIDKPGPYTSDRNKLEHAPNAAHRIRLVL